VVDPDADGERVLQVISERIGPWVRRYTVVIGGVLAGWGLTPNILTISGVILNAIVAVILGFGWLEVGGACLLIASAFDMLDGAVARATNNITPFGGFFDSTLDRYSEAVVYLGLLVYFFDTDDAKLGAILVFIAATGALLISYARARAEAAGYKASVGLLARTERVLLLAFCLLLGEPLWALWVLAVATHVTAITRIVHVWRASLQEPAPSSGPR